MDRSEDVVRRADAADLAAILSIDDHATIGSERVSVLAQRVESGDCFVNETEGHVRGFVSVHSRSFFGRDFIELIQVAPDFRRKGIASALLRASVLWSTTPKIFISANRSNLAMLNLLRKERWQFSGELEGLDVGDPELVFYRTSE
jgi:GNAT superfamily N-acetyltransferase